MLNPPAAKPKYLSPFKLLQTLTAEYTIHLLAFWREFWKTYYSVFVLLVTTNACVWSCRYSFILFIFVLLPFVQYVCGRRLFSDSDAVNLYVRDYFDDTFICTICSSKLKLFFFLYI